VDKALADYKMAVLLYAVEIEILNNLQSPERAKVLAEGARAYRALGKCLESRGRPKEAALDQQRAERLEADAKKLENTNAQEKEKTAAIQVTNAWSQAITLVVAGTTHRLEIGEQKMIPTPSSTVPYELEAGRHRSAGTLEAGKAYTIRPAP
jgi:hypothetical protein